MVAAMSLRWLLTAVFAAAALGALPVRKQPGSPQLAALGQGRAVTTWREARAGGRFWSRRRHPGSDLNAPNSGGAMIWMITAIPVAMPMASAGPAAGAMSGLPPPALTAVLVVSGLPAGPPLVTPP